MTPKVRPEMGDVIKSVDIRGESRPEIRHERAFITRFDVSFELLYLVRVVKGGFGN